MLSGCTILRPREWPRSSGEIILTFDDGPTPGEGTDQLLDVLKRHHVKATFCVIGRNVTANPSAVKRMVEEGHAVANHTFNHRLYLLKAGRMDQEIVKTDEAIRLATGNAKFRTTLFRPSYGLITPAVTFSREASSRETAYLTTYLGDAEVDVAHAPRLLERLKKRLLRKNGGAVVFHEMRYVPGTASEKPSKEWLPEAIDDFIVWAHANGLRFTTYRSDQTKS